NTYKGITSFSLTPLKIKTPENSSLLSFTSSNFHSTTRTTTTHSTTMNKQHRSSGSTNFASCVVATIFIIFIIIILVILFFTLFKPKSPQISVTSIQIPSFSLSNNTITFTLSQYVSVRNPNRADFQHYHSSLQLMYSGKILDLG
ncbi:hypothetical protein C5167_027475, partial [Papaver somniferum]